MPSTNTASDGAGQMHRTLAQVRPIPKSNSQAHTKGFHWYWGVIVVLSLIIICGAMWVFVRASATGVDSSRYQAVFLSNNQVYFGKLHHYDTNHPTLTDVWYIQTPSSDSTAKSSADQLQLTQLSKAVHGPEDEMLLNKSSILFVENLTSNSRVVKLIDGSK
ncbi:MAG TPA: hypothetical protein VFQ70_00305 [Candidatus Saccharimonadaceae bacterium]|nr:hypothetical protein [Candidatus Saccharimonadaceae bacterium]